MMPVRIMGIWDTNISPVQLGGLLIFVEELQIQRSIYGADVIEICFVGDQSAGLNVRNDKNSESFRVIDVAQSKYQQLLTAIQNIDGVETCYVCDKTESLKDSLKEKPVRYELWPVINGNSLSVHNYGSILYIQEFYQKEGYIPYLNCRSEPLSWALQFIQHNVLPHMPVVVHLKNNPHEVGCSNANFEAWLGFFKICQRKYNVTFVLIGSEDVPDEIGDLPNVIISRHFGSNLSRDLALIQISSVFVGMSSGPCVIKVFSDTPYLIYKNPDHHAEEMALELGDSNRFSFAAALQKFLRVFETDENLLLEFDSIYTTLVQRGWSEGFRR